MSADGPLASSAPPRQQGAAVFIALPSSCSYRRQDDAKKGGVTERRLPLDGAFSMNDEVRKRRHECGHNHGYGKRGYKIDKERLEVHVSGSWRLERQNMSIPWTHCQLPHVVAPRLSTREPWELRGSSNRQMSLLMVPPWVPRTPEWPGLLPILFVPARLPFALRASDRQKTAGFRATLPWETAIWGLANASPAVAYRRLQRKRRILEIVCVNCTFHGVTLVPQI